MDKEKRDEGLQRIYNIVEELYGDKVEVNLKVECGIINVKVTERPFASKDAYSDSLTIDGVFLRNAPE